MDATSPLHDDNLAMSLINVPPTVVSTAGSPPLELMGDSLNKFMLLHQTDVNIVQRLMGAASSLLLFW